MLFVQDLIKDYPSYVELPVQWGDMDAMQHVNNATYLRYFESSRIRFFQDIMKISTLSDEVGGILAEINCRYKFPLTYPDTIIAATRLLPNSIEEFSFQLQHIVVSTRYERIAAEGTAKIVYYDYPTKKKAPLPETIRQRLSHSLQD